MITVAAFSKPEEAHLLRMRLEAGGVRAFVQDENLVQLQWLYSDAIGGVRVQISEEDREQAIAILTDQTNPQLPDTIDHHCPRCGSRHISPDELPRRIAFAMVLFFSFPLLLGRSKFQCNACSHKWHT